VTRALDQEGSEEFLIRKSGIGKLGSFSEFLIS